MDRFFIHFMENFIMHKLKWYRINEDRWTAACSVESINMWIIIIFSYYRKVLIFRTVLSNVSFKMCPLQMLFNCTQSMRCCGFPNSFLRTIFRFEITISNRIFPRKKILEGLKKNG